MPNPKVGLNSFIGFGEQSGYTTSVTTTDFLPMISGGDSINREDATIKSGSLESVGVKNTRYKKGKRDVNGSETVELLYEGSEVLFKHLFGQVATSQPSPGGAPTVYDHQFTITSALPTGLTLEIGRSDQSFKVTGAKITSVELSQSVDQYIQAAFSFIGRDKATMVQGSASLPSVNGWVSPEVTLSWNNAQQDVKQWSVNIANNLDADSYFIGSKLRKEPMRGGRVEVKGSFETEFTSTTLWDDFAAATERQIIIAAVGDQIGSTGYYYSWTMTIPIALLTGTPINVNDGGPIRYTASWEAFRTASAGEVTLFIRNTVSTVSA